MSPRSRSTAEERPLHVHKSHIPIPTSAPATPPPRAFKPIAAPVEGLVDGAELLGVVTEDDGKVGVVEVERLMGGGTTVALLTGTTVVKVVVSGGETEVTVETMVVVEKPGVEVPGGAMETLTLTERDVETVTDAEAETEAGCALSMQAEKENRIQGKRWKEYHSPEETGAELDASRSTHR